MLPGPDENGEAGLDNALPWVKIKRAPYVPAGDLKGLVHPLAVRHQLREKQNKDLQDLEVTIAELKRLLERRAISLNESERRHEREALAARLKLRTAHGDKGSEVAAADGDQPVLDANASGQGDAARKNARGLVSAATAAKATEGRKDLLLIEAAHILSDEVGMLAPKLAAKRSRSKVPGYAQIAGSDGS
jgi:carboxyl-terminal processing protease